MHNTVVVESREAVLKESGDVILSGRHISAEVGEIFAGLTTFSPSETTIYKSVGVAIEDVVAAKLAVQNHLSKK
jgi:thiomorpholine-carboxylate dehydrogenase